MPGPGSARTVVVEVLGNTSSLELALTRAGVVANESSKTIQKAAMEAGRAAQAQAATAGKSADEQVAAAARVAAAHVESSAAITKAQRAAAVSATEAAKANGASADEQAAYAAKAIAEQRALEAATKETADAATASAAKQAAASREAALAAEMSAGKIGTTFEAGTARASSALTRLGQSGSSWGVPLSGSITKMGAQLDKATTSGQRFMATMGAAGKLTLGVAGIGALAVGYEGIKGVKDLEAQMLRTHTQAGATMPQEKALTQGVLGLAGEQGGSPVELAEGMYHVVSSMNKTLPAVTRTSGEINILKTALEGAHVGGAHLVDVTNALDALLRSGMPGVQNYGQAMNTVLHIVGAGDMTMQEFAEEMGTGVAVNAGIAGVSLRGLGAASAVLGDNNIRGAHAGTLLASALRIMASPSGLEAKALAAIGMGSHQMAEDFRNAHGNIVPGLEDLKRHLEATGAAMNGTKQEASAAGEILTRAFGGRQSTGVKVLLQELPALKAAYGELGHSGETLKQANDQWSKTLEGQLTHLQGKASELADKFGMFLIPKLNATAEAVSNVVKWMEKHSEVAKALGVAIGTVLGLAIATFVATRVVAFVGGIGRMGAAMLGFGTQMTATAGTVAAEGDAMVASADATAGGVDAAIGSTGIGLVIIGLSVAAVELATHWQESMKGMELAAQDAANFIIKILNKMSGVVSTLTFGLVNLGHISKATFAEEGPETAASGGFSPPGALKPGSLSLEGSGASQQVVNALVKHAGLSGAAARGVTATLYAESEGLKTTAQEKPGSTEGGYGIAQWTAARRKGLERYAAHTHQSGNALKTQTEYLIAELEGSQSPTLAKLQKAKTPQQAIETFVNSFEIPKSPSTVIGRAEGVLGNIHGPTSSSTHAGAPSVVSINAAMKKSREEYENKSTSTTAKKHVAAMGIPAAVATMLKTATSLVGAPYTHGGGHAGWDPVQTLKQIGIDCSGFVSQVLHSGGASLSSPLTTEGLASTKALARGGGEYVTVFDRANAGAESHTLIDILGHFFESGGSSKYNPSGGVAALTAKQARGELAGGGFFEFHPTGGLNAPVRGGLSRSTILGTSGANTASMVATAQEEQRREAATIAKRKETAANKEVAHNEAEAKKLLHAQEAIEKKTTAELKSTSKTLAAETAKVFKAAEVAAEKIKKQEETRETKGTTRLGTLENAIQSGTPKTLEKALGASEAHPGGQGSAAEKNFNKLIAELKDSHTKKLTELATKVTAAHKEALDALNRELIAQQTEAAARVISAEATGTKDQTAIIQAMSNGIVEAMKDAASAMTAAIELSATRLRDAGQGLTNAFSATATEIKDKAAEASERSQAQAQAIENTSKVVTDTLAERGLYGLNLVAQKQQVELDRMKSANDAGIAQAEQALTKSHTAADKAAAATQTMVDATQAQQDIILGAAKGHVAAVESEQHNLENRAKENTASVAKQSDAAVEAAVEQVAQAANESKAKQDEAAANLKLAEASQKIQVSQAEAGTTAAENAANQAIQQAQMALAQAEGTANVAEQEAQNALANAHGNAEVVLAQAETVISTLQGQATVSEAEEKAIVEKTRAEANTQYAGSGLQVNITGINPTDSAAIAAEVGWNLRTLVPT